MITYEEVLAAIVEALSGRPPGQPVLVAKHEIAEKKILDYLQQFISQYSLPAAREGHISSTANEEVFLTWSSPHESDQYSFVINAFDPEGGPQEVIILGKSGEGLLLKTFVDTNVMAISIPFRT